MDQAARIGLIIWVFLDDTAMRHRKIEFLEAEAIRLGFFVCVISDPNVVCSDRLLDFGNVHQDMSQRAISRADVVNGFAATVMPSSVWILNKRNVKTVRAPRLPRIASFGRIGT